MPLAAWIDERHLPPLGLSQLLGLQPLAFMAPDPRLAPGGMAEVAATVAALHAAGLEVILDVVFNHTGESDELGPTLSLRGLDNATYYRLAGRSALLCQRHRLRQHAGARPPAGRAARASTRCATGRRCGGVDGFRFDLATDARAPRRRVRSRGAAVRRHRSRTRCCATS